jgi:NitT/TauT family transport system ATP-binding protein
VPRPSLLLTPCRGAAQRSCTRRSKITTSPATETAIPFLPAGAGPEDAILAGPAISVEHIRRVFTDGPEPLEALADVSFHVAPEEILAVVGPNGSGKSTLLRILGGLLPPTAGRVEVGGHEVLEPDPRIGFVFQEPRLLPWRAARANVGLPMELAGWPAEARRQRTEQLLDLVGMAGVPDVRPGQLSGGMRQRLAVARALALGATVLLMDEPFSALDALTRDRMNVEMLRLWERTRSTTVLVTHSIPEAVLLADRVLVLSPRPARVAAEVRIELPAPRSLRTLGSPAFATLAGEVRTQLELASGGEADAAATHHGDSEALLGGIDTLGRRAWFDPFREEHGRDGGPT